MQHRMIVPSWSKDPHNDESQHPRINREPANLESFSYDSRVPQTASIEGYFVVVLQPFNRSSSEFYSFTLQSGYCLPNFRGNLHHNSLHLQIGEEDLSQVWVEVPSQPEKSLKAQNSNASATSRSSSVFSQSSLTYFGVLITFRLTVVR